MLIDLTEEEMNEIISAVHCSTQYYPSDGAFDGVVKMELAMGVKHNHDHSCIQDSEKMCRVCGADHNGVPCWRCGMVAYRNPENCVGCAGQSREDWLATDVGKAHTDYLEGKIDVQEYVNSTVRGPEEVALWKKSLAT